MVGANVYMDTSRKNDRHNPPLSFGMFQMGLIWYESSKRHVYMRHFFWSAFYSDYLCPCKHNCCHLSTSGQLWHLTHSPPASASALISCGPLSMSVRADCLLPVSVLAHLRICSGSPSGSVVAVVWEWSLFQCIFLAGNCLLSNWSARLELKCQALYQGGQVKRLYRGVLSCIDEIGAAFETMWLSWLLLCTDAEQAKK